MALAALAAAIGFIAGDRTASSDATTVTAVSTVTRTVTATARDSGVPAAVLEKRIEILRAAEANDYEAVARLAAPDGFEYTFGGPVEGGPAAYWRMLAAQGEDPLDVLVDILRLPYTLSRGIFVWPFAYDKTGDEITDYERSLLADIPNSQITDSGYLGWRAGIRPDGSWVFFVAGD